MATKATKKKSGGKYGSIPGAGKFSKEKLDKEMAQFEKLGIIDVGDAINNGIGAMSMDRVKAFHKLAVDSGIIEEGSVDVNKVATDKFVNKGHGLDIKKNLN